jgi:hypothetical protein
MFYSPLPPSPAKCVCLKLRVCERERRRERKDNASQKGGGEEDVEDAERKSKEIKAPSSLLGW